MVSVGSLIGYALGGAVNGAILMNFDVGSTLLWTVGGGIIAYTVTTLAIRIYEKVLLREKNVDLATFNWFNVLIMGIVNGFLFMVLRDNFSYGMWGTFFAGLLSFYALQILIMLRILGATGKLMF